MAVDIILPTMGESISEAVLLRWLKQTGDPVRRGEEIAEVETGKATMAIESPANGVLQQIVATEGTMVKTGDLLAIVGKAGESTKETPSARPLPVAEVIRPVEPQIRPAPSEPVLTERRNSPAARRLAQQLGIDITLVPPAKPGDRVTSEDVELFASKRAAFPAVALTFHYQELSDTRKTAALRMAESARTIPQFSASMDLEADALLGLQEMVRPELARRGLKASVTALLAWVVGRALVRYPRLNASYEDGRVKIFDCVNLAVAISTERGLVAPVIREIEKQSLSQIVARLVEIKERAQNGRLRVQDIEESTFTLSNLGMYGIGQFVPLVNPPHSAILGVGAIRPAVVPLAQGGTRHVHLLTLTVSADHRVVDGVDVSLFLTALKQAIEKPIAEAAAIL